LESIAAPPIALENPEILELTGSEPLTLEEENFCAVHRQSSLSKMNPERVEMKQTAVTALQEYEMQQTWQDSEELHHSL
jgi:uncharacterized protein YifE (UPF0438 family)